jgi:hypothetical protein
MMRISIKDRFRIFTDPKQTSQAPAHRLQAPTRGMNLLQEKITFFTNGSCINNGKNNARCSSRIWIAKNHPNNMAIRIPGENQSNQIAEISAILIILQ